MTGVAFLCAAGIATLGSLLTWVQGVSACGLSHLIFVHLDLWQLGLPLRQSWYSLDLTFVVVGAFVLALVGVNELGVPVLRWLDRWRWVPAWFGTVLIAAASLGAHGAAVSTGTGAFACGYSFVTGPGKWVCVAGAAIGAIGSAVLGPTNRWANDGAAVSGGIMDLTQGRRT